MIPTTMNQRQYYGNFTFLFPSSDVPDQTKRHPPMNVSDCLLAKSMTTQHAAEAQKVKRLSRLISNYDLGYMDVIRLFVIGAGGFASVFRNCARMGIGEGIIVDLDVVTEQNTATQDVRIDSRHQYKVHALASDFVKITPAASVLAIPEPIENIDDTEFSSLISAPLRCHDAVCSNVSDKSQISPPTPTINVRSPKRVILLVMTDNFWAQARGHRLGLQFGLPTICAQEYSRGRGAEVTYTVPGVTTSCHRCITSSRYRAYLSEDFQNDVTSEGAPIFATEFLNAVIGHILLALIHHGTEHKRWGNMVTRLGNRNLIRLRMDPDFDDYFGDTFGRRHKGAAGANSMFMLDSLFLPQTPDSGQSEDRPVCPDCGGTGNLMDAIGSFSDTRIMRE